MMKRLTPVVYQGFLQREAIQLQSNMFSEKIFSSGKKKVFTLEFVSVLSIFLCKNIVISKKFLL